jgi:predicted nucleic acid-binding protein
VASPHHVLEVFLDTSALFAGIFSSKGGARMVLRLGGAEAVQLLVSSNVLREAEGALRRKAPQTLGWFTLLLEQSRIEVTPHPTAEHVQRCLEAIGYLPDAQVLAAAMAADVDYFVTLDRRHFLDRAAVATVVPFPLGTPGGFLEWYRGWLLELASP